MEAGGTTRFNGATTLTSWKTTTIPLFYVGLVELQWGHDSDVVEDDELYAYVTKQAVLQWGHDSDVVEDITGNGWGTGLFMLQWGHDSDVVEDFTCRETLERARKASMGPRL